MRHDEAPILPGSRLVHPTSEPGGGFVVAPIYQAKRHAELTFAHVGQDDPAAGENGLRACALSAAGRTEKFAQL
jgi:hypothetical protein